MERNSAIKLIQIFRKIIIEAIRNDYIRKDPFVGFSLALDSVDPAFLNEQELINNNATRILQCPLPRFNKRHVCI